MLFRADAAARIRAGEVTRSYRLWKTPRVKVGGRYRLGGFRGAGGGGGFIDVSAVALVPFAAIKDADAAAAGFTSRFTLRDELRRASRGATLGARTKVFRVDFTFTQAADPREQLRHNASAEAVAIAVAKLEAMDRRSAYGSWTAAVLGAIAARPHVVSTELAAGLKRERFAFKADVRKLKGLGLTVSHNPGYALSELGKAVLKRLTESGDAVSE